MADPTGVTVRLDGGVAVLCLDGLVHLTRDA